MGVRRIESKGCKRPAEDPDLDIIPASFYQPRKLRRASPLTEVPQLPNEILAHIINFFPKASDLKNIRATCSSFRIFANERADTLLKREANKHEAVLTKLINTSIHPDIKFCDYVNLRHHGDYQRWATKCNSWDEVVNFLVILSRDFANRYPVKSFSKTDVRFNRTAYVNDPFVRVVMTVEQIGCRNINRISRTIYVSRDVDLINLCDMSIALHFLFDYYNDLLI